MVVEAEEPAQNALLYFDTSETEIKKSGKAAYVG